MLSLRRLMDIALLIAAFGGLGAPSPAAASSMTVDGARAYLLSTINTARSNKGLAPVTVDLSVQGVAQTRSDDMASNHYFGHLSDKQLTAMFNDRGIRWSKIGEILSANDWPHIASSADEAMQGWRNSSTHWSIITDSAYNFMGVGVAKDSTSGNWIWTVEFSKEPTSVVSPSATITSAVIEGYKAGRDKIKVSWSGTPGTNPIKDYRVQYRINAEAWKTLLKATTKTSDTVQVHKGKTVQFRIRARDKSLNSGSWSLSSIVRV